MRLHEILKEYTENDRLYHLSFNGNLEGKWNPRLPAGTEIKTARTDISEPNIKRISVADSILGCVRAIYPNISQYFEELNYPYVDIFVYSPVLTNDTIVVNTDDIVKRRFVWDAHITKEKWIVSPVYMKLVKRIRVKNPVDTGGIIVYPFGDYNMDKKWIYPAEIKYAIIEDYQ